HIAQALPIDAMKAKGVIRIPQNRDRFASVDAAKQPVEKKNSLRCVPFFGQYENLLLFLESGNEKILEQIWWQGGRVIWNLSFFTVVDPDRMILTDPLAPAVEMHASAYFVTGQVGIAHEPEMCFDSRVD